MTPVLATLNGSPVTDIRVPARFYSSSGTLYADTRRIPLGEAYARSRAWFAESLTLHRKGHVERAAHLRETALALEDAAREAIRWRVAAGHEDPLAVDRQGGVG